MGMGGDNMGFDHVLLSRLLSSSPPLGQLFISNPLNGMKNAHCVRIYINQIPHSYRHELEGQSMQVNLIWRPCNPESFPYGG